MNRHLFGGLLITSSMFIFSFIGPFVRHIKLPPLVIIFYASLFSLLILSFYFLITKKTKPIITRQYFLWMIMSALFVLGNLYTYFKAFRATTMANAVLTHYTAPIFAALLAPLLLKEKIEKVTLIALLFSMTGLFLIASNGIAISRQHLSGIAYGLLSGFCYGISILIGKKLVDNFQPTVILFYQCAIMVIILAPFLNTFQYNLTPYCFSLLILYALFVTILAAFLYLNGLRRVEAQHAGIFAYSEPVIVIMIGILFYNEMPSLKMLLGGVLIIYSGYLVLKAESSNKIFH